MSVRVFPKLNYDCTLRILTFLYPRSLVSLARTCKAWSVCVRPHLVWRAYLSRSPEHVLQFCLYVLKYELACHMRSIHISVQSAPAVFAFELAKVLERATSLASF